MAYEKELSNEVEKNSQMEIKLVVKFKESCLFKNKDKGVKKHHKKETAENS